MKTTRESFHLETKVVASIVLMVERMTCRKKDFASCHKYNLVPISLWSSSWLLTIAIMIIIFILMYIRRYNAAIGCLTIIFIVVNILATAFGGPDNYCARYGWSCPLTPKYSYLGSTPKFLPLNRNSLSTAYITNRGSLPLRVVFVLVACFSTEMLINLI